MIYWTGDSFVIEMAILLSNLCWAGERKTGQTSQHQSNIFYFEEEKKWIEYVDQIGPCPELEICQLKSLQKIAGLFLLNGRVLQLRRLIFYSYKQQNIFVCINNRT